VPEEIRIPRRAGDDSVPEANASRSLRIDAPCLRAELYNEFCSDDQYTPTDIERVRTIGRRTRILLDHIRDTVLVQM
jgi:hypothetical protein